MTVDNLLSCISKTEDGVYIDITVSPGSSINSIDEVNRWRKRLEIQIKEKAEGGEANKELIEFFAKELNISPKKVSIVKGKRSKNKRMYIKLESDLFINKLNKIIED